MEKKVNHVNTLKTRSKTKNIEFDILPEALGIDGECFTNRINLHFRCKRIEDPKFILRIRRISDLLNNKLNEREEVYDNVPLDYILDISNKKSGEYEIRFRGYINDGNSLTTTKENIYHFTIISRVKPFYEIGFNVDGKNISEITDNRERSIKMLISIKTGENGINTFHRSTVRVLGTKKKYNVIYETCDGGDEKPGLKTGLVFIPEEVPIDSKIILNTYEYLDKDFNIMLDEEERIIPLTELDYTYTDFSDPSSFILMSEPKENVYSQHINISFNNVNDEDEIRGYKVIKDGKVISFKRVNSDKTHIVLNNSGRYKVISMVTSKEDEDFLNPKVKNEKTYYILEHEDIIFNLPEKIKKGYSFNVQIRGTKIKEVKTYINKYTDKKASKKINNLFESRFDTKDLPSGYHLVIAEITYTSGKTDVITKEIEVVRPSLDETKIINRAREILDNTTFVFTGHNIKTFAALSMESLILNCNISRDNIVYFNDNSTDGTSLELANRGIYEISWEEDIYNEFISSPLILDLPFRVDMIMKSIFKTLKNKKYICFLDGDNFYYEDTIIRLLQDAIKKNPEFDLFSFEQNRAGNIIEKEKYKGLSMRLYQNYFYINMDSVRNTDILDNGALRVLELRDKYGKDAFNNLYDTGTIIYNNVEKSNLKTVYEDFDGEYFEEITTKAFHIGWLSSSMHDDNSFCGDWDKQYEKILNFINDEKNTDLFKRADISKDELMDNLKSSFRGGLGD